LSAGVVPIGEPMMNPKETGSQHSTRDSPDTVKLTNAVYTNLLMVNAIMQLLDERGVLSMNDVEDRVKELQAEARIKLET